MVKILLAIGITKNVSVFLFQSLLPNTDVAEQTLKIFYVYVHVKIRKTEFTLTLSSSWMFQRKKREIRVTNSVFFFFIFTDKLLISSECDRTSYHRVDFTGCFPLALMRITVQTQLLNLQLHQQHEMLLMLKHISSNVNQNSLVVTER